MGSSSWLVAQALSASPLSASSQSDQRSAFMGAWAAALATARDSSAEAEKGGAGLVSAGRRRPGGLCYFCLKYIMWQALFEQHPEVAICRRFAEKNETQLAAS